MKAFVIALAVVAYAGMAFAFVAALVHAVCVHRHIRHALANGWVCVSRGSFISGPRYAPRARAKEAGGG